MSPKNNSQNETKSWSQSKDQMILEQLRRYDFHDEKSSDAYDNMIGEEPGSPTRKKWKDRWDYHEGKKKKALEAIDRIKNFPESDRQGASLRQSNAREEQVPSFLAEPEPATPPTNSLLNKPNSAPAVPGLATNKVDLPPLVRRDRQALSQPESFYPSMAYDEDQHEPWSDEAVVEAVRLYPGLAEKKSVAKRLAGMTATPVQDTVNPWGTAEQEDEPSPGNPTLRGTLRHLASRKKMF
jgi:hypothetical protein